MKKYLFVIPFLFFLSPLTSAQGVTESPKKETGYFNLTSLSAIIGTPNDQLEINSIVPSLTMVNGYSFNRNFSAGIGVGAEIFEYAIFPVFADLRYKISRSGYQPYLALKGGYAFANSSKHVGEDWAPPFYYSPHNKFSNTGGWMFNPEVGIYLPINPKIDIAIGLGYRYQELETEVDYYYDNEPTGKTDNFTTTLNRLTISVGFLFR